MKFITLFLIAVGLSMDAFAVAICKGLCMKKINYKQMFLIALFFGGFQGIMPFLGWLIGSQFAVYITRFDHWIAFGLLVLIGGNMLREAIKGEEEETNCEVVFSIKELTLLAVATSIDALAVGVSFAFLKMNILLSVVLIGITTFIISAAGVLIGHKFGGVFKRKAEIAGGCNFNFNWDKNSIRACNGIVRQIIKKN